MTRTEAVQPVAIRTGRPATGMQARLWASQRLHPDAPLANMATRSTIDGVLDADRFVAAFDEVVQRADALRSVVVDDAAGVRLRVLPEPPARTEVLDLPRSELEDWCAARVARPLDATRAGYDSVLLRHDADCWTWWLDIHHVLTDAVSSALVFQATAATYAGSPLELGSFEEVLGERGRDDGDARRTAARVHWSGRPPAGAPLALYGPLGPRTPAGDRLPLALGPGLGPALDAALEGPYRSISRELGLLALAATATAVLVHRTDGRQDVTLGIPVHHRGRDAGRVVGPLLELFPLDVHVALDDTYATLHRRVLRGVLDLLRRAEPGTSPAPDYSIVLNVLTARFGDFAGLPCATTWVPAGAADPEHLLRLQVYDFGGDGLRVELDVNHAVGDADARRRVPGHLERVLAAAVGDPDEPIGAVTLPDAEERALIALLDDLRGAPELTETVDAAIRRVLAADPDRPVVDDLGRWRTAGELDAAADGLARWLVEQGVGVGDRVGIRLPRSADALVAVQGVLRAGGVFVLLDPDDPGHRHDLILADAGCVLVLDEVPDVAPGPPPEVGPRALDDLAYILYTSGSTGAPKGVPIPHRGLAGYLRFALDAYVDPARPPVMALHSSMVFDLTITSLFLPLLAGGSVVVFRGAPVDALAGVAADPRIDLLKLTPSQLELYLQLTEDATGLRTVIVGGEAFRRPLALALTRAGHPELRIFNEYGPTEAVVGCMIHRFDAAADLGPDVPIGGSCPDSELAVLDAHQRVAPLGSWGELYVRRPGMAAGYLHLPSADRFAPVAAVPGPPLYRTGDRVRIERPGVAVYGGRLDDQLKIGGVRFEPGEIEAALVEHPDVANAVVRLWSPRARAQAVIRCLRCGVGTDVPGISVDADGVCSSCRDFDAVEPQAAAWFRDLDDLRARRDAARARRWGRYDCLHLLSGGKDSTYALYRLVDEGWDVYALTLDNGFISEGAKENVRRTVADLGIDHEFATVDGMPEIFRDSLERYSNVCNGCYKTIYTLGVTRAHELGIPAVVTGLSRGQFFETRLVPHQFDAGHFDPAAIDEAVLEARKVYHRTPDAVSAHLDTSLFADDAIFSEVEFVDFYRYVDVDLAELYRFLDERAPWVRPDDTGRSTNCLINAAGIYVHQRERGFHNYALPYSWDVRLGHKTRDEALDELDDDLDEAEVQRLLDLVGYEPRTQQVLTAWYQADRDLEPAELRAHLRERLPEHAVPAAFVRLEELPLAASAKIDTGALPAPTRIHRSGSGHTPPTTPIATQLCELWAEVLGLERVGVDDDFFDVGGNSLGALEMITRAAHAFGVEIPDTAAFRCRTVRELEAVVAPLVGAAPFAAAAPVEVAAPAAAGPASIPRVEGHPLSPGQEALLYEVLADPDSPRFAITRRYDVDGTLDADLLRAALVQVIAAHEPLHVTVTASGERRVVPPEEALAWQVLPAGTDVDAVADRQARTRFDPARPPFVRATVVQGERPAVVLSLHHLWCDAGSFAVLWDDVARVCAGEPLPERPVRYRDHAAWLPTRVTDEDRAFWRDLLDGVEGSPELGLARPAVPEGDGYRRRRLRLDRQGPSLLAQLLVALDVVLSDHTDDPVVVGVPVTTRDHPAVADLVGYFLDDVVVPLPPVGDDLGALARATEERLAEVLRHRALPYAEVVAERRRAGRSPDLVGVMAVHDVEVDPTLPGAVLRGETIANGTAVTDLTFFVIEAGERVDLAVEWSGRRYRAAEVDALLDRVAEALVAGPGVSLAELRSRWAPDDLVGPPSTPPTPTVLHQIVARAEDDAVAVSQGAHRLTYRQLLAAAGQLARALVAAGVGRGDRVALVLSRRVETVAAVLGVQLAGAAYVPIDPDYPPERVAAILASADPAVVVAEAGTVGAVGDRPVLVLDDLLAGADLLAGGGEGDGDGAGGPELSALPALPGADDGAYVIHTSGSTGTPRGVLVRHGELAASTAARRRHYGGDPTCFLWTSSYGFDSSVAGLFWTLVGGGQLVLPDDGATTDVGHLVERAAASGATHLLTVPSLWAAMVERAGDRLAGLEAVVVAGEACPASLVDAHHAALPDVALWNEYGPTEATVWATVHRCRPGEVPVPIGRPVPGMTARVAGASGRPRPVGVAGELWLAGPQVTGGYLGDEAATAEKFVVDDAGRRWYRTGDRVVRRPDDVLEFLGRVDGQLNLRGVRVEPGEVEAALRAVPGITEAVVRVEPRVPADLVGLLDGLPRDAAEAVLAEARRSDRPGTALATALAAEVGTASWLVAHVEGRDLDEARVRAEVARGLPAAAVPHRVVAHPRLPRTTHGKLDPGALPLAPAVYRGGAGDGGPASPLARRIAEVWRTVLGDLSVDEDTDVFDAGADSLHALRAVAELSAVVGVELEVSVLLDARTPRALARRLGDGADVASPFVPLRAGTRPDHPPLLMLAHYGGQADAMLASYLPLVGRLPSEVEIVGVRRPEDDLLFGDDVSIERLARDTVDDLRASGTTGPLWLFGASINGLVAIEVARRWQDEGGDVAYVGLGDTFFPGEIDGARRIMVVRRYRKYRDHVRSGEWREAASELETAARRRLGRPPRRLPPAPARDRAEYERGLRLASRRYVPRLAELPAVLYAASATPGSRTVAGWRSVLPGLEVVAVRGSHTGRRNFLHEARIGPVAGDLAARLRRSLAHRPSA